MKRLLTIVALTSCMMLKGDTLQWRVDDTAFVDGVNMMTFCNNYPDTDDSYVGARVKATYNGGQTVLAIAYPDFPSEQFDHAYVGYSIDEDRNPITDPSDPHFDWGTGNWATQSPFDHELLKEALFKIEIGQLTYNDGTGLMDWATIAESEPESKAALSRYIFLGGVNVPADDQWTPTVYHAVPEPSSLLLVLYGLGIIALTRRHA